MIDLYSVRMNNLEKQKNKFEQMGFVKFWFFSSLFFITFPFSLIYSLVFPRSLSNKRIYTSAYKRLYPNINNYFHLFDGSNIFFI
jgi:dolichyl-phosphate-mannose--protein O-mannosyl transferase